MDETFVATATTNVAKSPCQPPFATFLAHLDKTAYSHLSALRLPLLPSNETTNVDERKSLN